MSQPSYLRLGQMSGRYSYLILVIGFVSFCFALILQTLTLWETRWREQERSARRQRFDEAVHHREFAPSFALFPWKVMLRVRNNWVNHLEIQEFCATHSRLLGMKASYLQFQESHDLLVYPPATDTKELFRDVFTSIALPEPQFSHADRRLQRPLREEFGIEGGLAFLRWHLDEFFPFTRHGRPGIGIMSLWRDGTGIVILMDDVPERMKREVERYAKRRKALSTFVGKAMPEREVWLPPPGVGSDALRLVYQLTTRAGVSEKTYEGREWLILRNRQGFVDFWVEPAFDLPWLRSLRVVLWVLYPLLLWWTVRLVRDLFRAGEEATRQQVLSLRTQVRFFLGAVTLLPLGSAIALALMLETDMGNNLRERAFSTGTARLQSLYLGLDGHLVRTARRSREFADLIASYPFDQELIRREAKRHEDLDTFAWYAIMDGSNRLLMGDMHIWRPDIYNLMEKLCRLVVRRFVPHRVVETAGRVETIEVFLEEVATNEQLGWAEVLENPNVVQKHQLGGASGNLYWTVFPHLSTGPAFLACALDTDRLVRSFFEPILASSPSAADFVFGIHQRHFEIVAPVAKREIRPMLPLVLKTHKTATTVQGEVKTGTRRWWVVAMPENYSGYYILAWAADADQALLALRPLRWALFAGLLATLAVVFGVYRLLVNMVLAPIGDLRTGIAAIRQRQTGVRLPIRRADEFGELAMLFNRTLSGLQELELARLVQTQLLPARIPEVAGYTLAAENLTATELSGDYYDLVPLGDDTLLAVIGDVTGHGAPAALAMAMARAIIAARAADGEKSPAEYLRSLNEVFFQDMKPTRRFMTFLAGRLHMRAHKIEFANAGHNYPLVYRAAAKSVETPEMPGLPLGIRRQVPRTSHEIDLLPGDALVYYTDGYTESLMPDGTQVGPERLEAMLQDEAPRAADAARLLKALVERLDAIRRPGPRDDDVTMLVISRNRLPAPTCASEPG
ncbi:MAG TPA: PP2C family protein-serine/threonine phosphatase [Candidatus Ozemobacteraceae bacterium]|nr:PP2C family protein-serine/threonine phosphatase [Candidatus Ozemobacteraceae bacterium]